eukprot:365661-Chlamydomonas_euryale.AAC.46
MQRRLCRKVSSLPQPQHPTGMSECQHACRHVGKGIAPGQCLGQGSPAHLSQLANDAVALVAHHLLYDVVAKDDIRVLADLHTAPCLWSNTVHATQSDMAQQRCGLVVPMVPVACRLVAAAATQEKNMCTNMSKPVQQNPHRQAAGQKKLGGLVQDAAHAHL